MDDYPVQMKIETKNGEAVIEKIYFTELGHVMAKIYNPSTKSWVRINIGCIESMLDSHGITVKEFTTFKPVAFSKSLK